MSAFEPDKRHMREDGDAALSETRCRDWFRRFRSGDFAVKDAQEELAAVLGVTRQAISSRLKVLGMIQKEGKWIPSYKGGRK